VIATEPAGTWVALASGVAVMTIGVPWTITSTVLTTSLTTSVTCSAAGVVAAVGAQALKIRLAIIMNARMVKSFFIDFILLIIIVEFIMIYSQAG
jgi:hypothetical protein